MLTGLLLKDVVSKSASCVAILDNVFLLSALFFSILAFSLASTTGGKSNPS